MSQLSDFESAAVRAIVEKNEWTGDLHAGISSLQALEREWSGVGFYTTILHKDSEFRLKSVDPLQPPTIVVRHPELPHDGIVTLWVNATGHIEAIEAVSFAAEPWPAGSDCEFRFDGA
jgi:hypothetical protein